MRPMNFSPLYRNTVGYQPFASMLDNVFCDNTSSSNYPPYNIEQADENNYAVVLAVAGFTERELEIQLENGVLTVTGKQDKEKEHKKYLHQGIAARSFERKFTLADHIKVSGAQMKHGLLTIRLEKELPESMQPKTIAINNANTAADKLGKNKSAA